MKYHRVQIRALGFRETGVQDADALVSWLVLEIIPTTAPSTTCARLCIPLAATALGAGAAALGITRQIGSCQAGVLEINPQPQIQPPAFVCRGLGDEHWREGLPRDTAAGRSTHERVVIMACGCQASVP